MKHIYGEWGCERIQCGNRYYHIFRDGEMEELVDGMNTNGYKLRVDDVQLEQGNYIVVLRKICWWEYINCSFIHSQLNRTSYRHIITYYVIQPVEWTNTVLSMRHCIDECVCVLSLDPSFESVNPSFYPSIHSCIIVFLQRCPLINDVDAVTTIMMAILWRAHDKRG